VIACGGKRYDVPIADIQINQFRNKDVFEIMFPVRSKYVMKLAFDCGNYREKEMKDMDLLVAITHRDVHEVKFVK